MEELVSLVAKKAGISNSQATKAVDTVLDFLNDRLPEPVGGHIEEFLEGDASQDTIDQVTKGLGGLLNK
jgi:hypothetical protein